VSLHSEILEQPQRLAAVLEGQRRAVERVAREILARDIQYIFLAAGVLRIMPGGMAITSSAGTTIWRLPWQRPRCSPITRNHPA